MPANPDRPLFTRRRILTTAALAGAGALGGTLFVANLRQSPVVSEPSKAIAGAGPEPIKTPDAPPVLAPIETPKPPTEQPSPTAAKPTEAPKPTAAATATATSAPSPTEAPKPTAAATATAIEKPKSAEKSPLPTYQPFMGDFFDDKGNKTGMIVVSSIPIETPVKTTTKDNVFVYYISGDKKIGYTVMAFMAKTESIQEDGTFLALDNAGISRIQAKLDNTGKILSGKVGNGQPGGPTTWKGNFPALNRTGASGKEAVLNSVRQEKAEVTNLGYVSPAKVSIAEIKRMVDYDKWPE